MNDLPVTIEVDDLASLVHELQPLCDHGFVCDLILRDGTQVSAVLIGVSSTALIADHWDTDQRRPAGDPFVVDLATVRRVVVP
ncbi:MAG TPA: hypothetical protein VHB02_03795 [Acidimicrobiales bacterium]|nr:hypothetical protein [Acidimicrobiales bacterium]